ncbi:LemA family protein [Marinobacterium rhizophilum]|uniref:LemA family protein n=1 Tax=Marinobacterium rhizophilum TaxID=420402 RepID=A0ABY5HGM2_9GAMM|nr:LemA family protein [Marinobacterium rhizophilum]UTW11521.1 LemA family protein [Marinobacterium rhizophilum]
MNDQDADIERLLREGKLTVAEAARLRRLWSGTAAESARQTSRAPRAAMRRGHWRLWLLPVLLLVIAFVWLHANDAGDLATSVQEADIANRPVDLGRLDQERSDTMQRTVSMSYGAFGLIVLALVTALLAWLYNGLVGAREQVNAGWAQVENQYQRRLDLVPLLIDSVQTYMDHERETLATLTEARARALGAMDASDTTGTPDETQLRAVQQAQSDVQSALSRLLLAVEAYPDLKASQNFRALQDQIEGTENRVAIERRHYNEFARAYNTRLQTFPANLVGNLAGFRFKPYFEAQALSREGIRDAFAREE